MQCDGSDAGKYLDTDAYIETLVLAIKHLSASSDSLMNKILPRGLNQKALNSFGKINSAQHKQ